MSESTGEKVLRIGVIQGGKILEERLLRKRGPVTVGTDPKNSFVLTGDAPRSFKLLDLVLDRYVLCFDDEMRGRLTSEGETLELEAIKAKGLALQTGSVYRIELSESARGKVAIGDLTILFQFVVPPQHERSQLPTRVGGGWSTALDWPLALCLGLSLLAHGVVLARLRAAPQPPARTLFDLPGRLARSVLPERPIEQSAPLPPPGRAAATARAPAAPASMPAAPPVVTPGQVAASRPARRGVLRIIGATGPGAGAGSTVDLLAVGGRSGDLDAVLQNVAGVGVPGVEPAGAPAPAGPGVRAAASSRAAAATSQAAGVVTPEPVELVAGALDRAALAAVTEPRLGYIKWCYREALARDPQRQGRLVIGIVLEADGRVQSSKVEINTLGDDAAGRCVESVIKRAPFPAPGPGGAQLRFSYSFAI
jgi:hypothetical protein